MLMNPGANNTTVVGARVISANVRKEKEEALPLLKQPNWKPLISRLKRPQGNGLPLLRIIMEASLHFTQHTMNTGFVRVRECQE
jgi:hypothetical protein